MQRPPLCSASGGQMQGRLLPSNDEERQRAEKMGADVTKKYTIDDMAHGDVIFSATGVTDGSLAAGRAFPRRLSRKRKPW